MAKTLQRTARRPVLRTGSMAELPEYPQDRQREARLRGDLPEARFWISSGNYRLTGSYRRITQL
jgi:hypothetical protein